MRTSLTKEGHLLIETGCCGNDEPLLSVLDKQPPTLDFVYAGVACLHNGKCVYKENSFRVGKVFILIGLCKVSILIGLCK